MFYLDSTTGTYGMVSDLLVIDHDLPEDFSDWSDSERVDYFLLSEAKQVS